MNQHILNKHNHENYRKIQKIYSKKKKKKKKAIVNLATFTNLKSHAEWKTFSIKKKKK